MPLCSSATRQRDFGEPVLTDVTWYKAAALSRAFAEQKQILVLTTLAKKPEIRSEAYSEVLKGLQTEIGAVTEIRETNSATPWKNHLSMVSDGSNTLGWIAITDSKPADFIIEFLGGAQLYGNRVLKDK